MKKILHENKKWVSLEEMKARKKALLDAGIAFKTTELYQKPWYTRASAWIKGLFVASLILLAPLSVSACQEATMTFKQNGVVTQFSKTCVHEEPVAQAPAPTPLPTNETIVTPQLSYTTVYVPEDAVVPANPALSEEAVAAAGNDGSVWTQAVQTNYVDMDGKPIAEKQSVWPVILASVIGLFIVLVVIWAWLAVL